MSGETNITVIGNLVDDAELRFTASGAAVASFRIASTPRTFNKETNGWKDGETLWLTCSVWRDQAEHVAESLTKGMRVIVTGRLKSRQWETREGEKRTSIEIDVDEVGPSLKRATVTVHKTEREKPSEPSADPWSTPAQNSNGLMPQSDPWAAPADNAPPF